MPYKKHLRTLINKASDGSLGAQLMRAGIASLVMRVASMALALGLTILLARVLGPEEYGIYVYIFTLILIMVIPAHFGLPRLLIRETAKTQVDENWGKMRGMWRWGNGFAGILTIVLSLVALAISWTLSDHFSAQHFATFLWGLILLPFIVLAALQGAALQGLRHVVAGMMPEQVARPALLIMAILALLLWGGQPTLDAATVMSAHALAGGISLLVAIWLLYRARPAQLAERPAPVYETKAWLAAILPLALSAGMQQINNYTDIVMLGYMASSSEVGIYRISIQMALLTGFGLHVIGMFISPYFARLHAQNDMRRLQQLATRSARAAMLVALPIFLIVLFWGDWIIGTLFGARYQSAWLPLVILACGQLIHSFFGFVGVILNMTGHERAMARSVTISAVLNIVLNAALIPQFGMRGAALATAITLVIWNIMLWRAVYHHLRIDTMAVRAYGHSS